MTKLVMCLAIIGLVVAMPNSASAWFIDFESTLGPAPSGDNGTPVDNITGISFQSYNGYTSIYGDSRENLYNTYSDTYSQGWNGASYHHLGYQWLWAGGDASAAGVIVDFTNNDGTFFSTGYASSSTFVVTAYLTDNTNVSVTGGGNLYSPMSFLTVSNGGGAMIDYVVLHDSGNYWLVDNMSGDATGIPDGEVPEPGTLVLFGVLAVGAGIVSRRRRRV